MAALALAFVAGALTTINPCVLPLLPVVMGTALAASRFGPLAFASGMIVAFTAVGTAIAATGTFLGVGEQTLRTLAGALFVIFGVVLLLPAFERKLAIALMPIGSAGGAAASRLQELGAGGQFGVGLLAGAIWIPCSGPTLGAAIALAAEAGAIPIAALRMAAFGLGAASVLALLALGSHALVHRRHRALAGLARAAKPTGGVLFVVVGLAVLTGFDKRVEALFNQLAPDWLITLTTSV